MKILRIFLLFVCCTTLLLWLVSYQFPISFGERRHIHCDSFRSGILVSWRDYGPSSSRGLYLRRLERDELAWYRLMNIDVDSALARYQSRPRNGRVFIPHWVTNSFSWMLYLVVFLLRQRYPRGHCQGCGYDLTGNESGVCPECYMTVEVAA